MSLQRSELPKFGIRRQPILPIEPTSSSVVSPDRDYYWGMPPASPLPAGDPHRVITGPDGVVEVIVSLDEYQQLRSAREELRRLRRAPDRAAIAAQMREGLAQFAADPTSFRTLTREDLLQEDIFDRP